MAPEQRGLFIPDLDPDEQPKDSWCTEPAVMEAVHRFWPGGIALDPCSNGHAVGLGFARARVAWSKVDDCTKQPTWDVEPFTTCWLQPPYSRQGAPIIADWARRWDAGEMHETLALVRLDTSSASWAALASRAAGLVLFNRRLSHYSAGVRVDGSNLCSAMFMMTRSDPRVRRLALQAAVSGLGRCYS